ncbi:unnamed protein product [Phytomonas sp. Hart1]|nr:unnamed protein product [Phytomonas sp. Hart1]|eukprot:CCW69993.1 unnamed protein product [Phytomonas sp. isolate Hart1]
MEAFHTFKQKLLSICNTIERLWAPRSTELRVIQREPHNVEGVPKEISAAQCLHFLRLRMVLIDKYARLASCSCLVGQSSQNSSTICDPSFFQMESFDKSIWQCTLSIQNPIARRFWSRSVRTACSRLAPSYPLLVKVLQKDWHTVLRKISQAPAHSDKEEPQQLYTGKLIVINDFLKCFFCGGNQIEFLREEVIGAEDADTSLNIFYDLSCLVFGKHGVNAFHKCLPELSDMGFNLCDLAYMIIACVAENGSEDVAGFIHRTNLGALCTVMNIFPEDAFISAIERVLISLQVRNTAPESSPQRLEVLRKTEGALFAILTCCVAREHSDPNRKCAKHSTFWYPSIAQLLQLWIMASQNMPKEDKAKETNTSKYSIGSFRVGLRMAYLLPRTKHRQADTFETFLLHQHMPIADVHLMASLIDRSDAPEIVRRSRLYTLVSFSPLIRYKALFKEEATSTAGLESCFEVKYPWIENETWHPEVFQKLLLEPLQKEWGLVASVDANELGLKTSVEQRWRLVHQCCVLMTAVNCLQENILRPFKEATLPFWNEQVVPNGGELFALTATAIKSPTFQTPRDAFTFWLKGSRSNRDFLSSALALSQLTMHISDAVLTRTDESKWVSLVKHISTCLAEDDVFVFPTIPASLRLQLKILMQCLCVNTQLLQFRLEQANAFVSTLFFLIDLGSNLIEILPDSMSKRKLIVPWVELFGDPVECFTLTPTTLLNVPTSSSSGETSLDGKHNARIPDRYDALYFHHGGGYPMFLRARSTFARSFLLHCIIPNSGEEGIFENPQRCDDICRLLRKLCTVLGLINHVPELPELIFLDYQIKNIFPGEQIQLRLLYIGDKIMLSRVAASNARAIIRSCIQYWTTQVDTAKVRYEAIAEKYRQLNAVLTPNCKRWLQSEWDDSELDFSIEHHDIPLAYMVGGDGWVTVDEQKEIDASVHDRLMSTTGNESRNSLMELIFLLVQLANEGKSAFSEEGQAIMTELPKIVEFLRRSFQ